MVSIETSKGKIQSLGDTPCPSEAHILGLTGLMGEIKAIASSNGVHRVVVGEREIFLKLETKLPKWFKVGARVDIDLYRGRITKI